MVYNLHLCGGSLTNHIPVKGYPGFVRDEETGALLNVDTTAVDAAREKKRLWKEQQREMNQLKQDVSEIKDALKIIMEKL